MKIQFALVHPDLVADPSDVSPIAGIVQTDQVIDDYTTIPFVFHHEDNGSVVLAKHVSTDNLLTREHYWQENITTNTFHGLLTLDIWRGVSSSQPAGEVAFVKTNFPNTPEGQFSYAIFGLIKGQREKLAAMSGRIFESRLDPVMPMGGWDMIKTHDTGIKVIHEMGYHVLDGITKPVWGFGDKKYGMASDISAAEFENIEKNTRNLIEHGEGLPGSLQSHPDPKYLAFIRKLDAQGLVPSPQWTDAEYRAVIDKASNRIIREVIAEEATAPAKKASRAIDDEPSP